MAKVDYEIRAIMNEYSPCLVDGQKALFHRWVEETKVLIHLDRPMMPEKIDHLAKMRDEKGAIPVFCEPFKITNTYGLVEFEDGHIEKVEPTNVKFIDHVKIFEEYCWPEEMKEEVTD